MKLVLLSIAIMLLFLHGTHGRKEITELSPRKTHLTVYYDSMCPYSKRFIKNLLYPLMNSPVGTYVHLKMVPYGTASTTTRAMGDTVKCTHGVNECYYDKIHACVLKMFRKNVALKYINCMVVSSTKDRNLAEKCATNSSIDFSLLEDCANGKSGIKYLLENGVRTNSLNPPLTQVPWVVFNGVYSQEKMSLAVTNLQSAVCKEIGEEVCKILQKQRK